ncbi:MAG: hypothetical protein NC341_09140 [Blautia sp.]|nr:hypothetical protein [Blautia sp.]MCM1201845.1 hypothetical protein [Bacteroides fragilis]
MAVYRWIYANAKMEGNRKDYHIRVCDPGLESYKHILILLSNRLLSTEKRYDDAGGQKCWFSGYIDERMYFMAVGGDQKELIGVFPDGYRNQHCVLGYGLTGNHIQPLRKEEELFDPLKEILREIQRTGKDWEPDGAGGAEPDFSAYAGSREPAGNGEAGQEALYNIIRSTEETDSALWRLSLQRPVMTGIISVDDARKLLKLFPGGIVSVMEDVEIRYYEKKERSAADRRKEKAEKKAGADSAGKNMESGLQRTSVLPGGEIREAPSQPETPVLYVDEDFKRGLMERAAETIAGQIRKGGKGKAETEERKYKKELEESGRKREIIKSYANWCGTELPPEQRKAIKEAVKELRREMGFKKEELLLEQLKCYGYMFFWQKYHKKEWQEDERYIYYALKYWIEKMKNDQEALENNLLLAKAIKELRNG